MFEVVVTDRTEDAEGIAVFELAHPEGLPLPAFSAGSHVDVAVPTGLVRQYSLCNGPHERHRYVIGVLRETQSRGGSRAMHERVKVGDRISISEPRNLFRLREDARRTLLFAGGIGITPIASMAEHLAATGADFELRYCARSASRAALARRLAQSSFSNRVFTHFDDDGADARLPATSLLEHPVADTHLYVCGPPGFIDFLFGVARQAGWAPDALHREYFSSSGVGGTASDTGFRVRLARSGRTVDVPHDMSIAAALAASGVPVPLSCEAGVCGTCLTGVLEGEPDHRDFFLTDAEHAANDRMTLCCSRSRSPLLVLDL